MPVPVRALFVSDRLKRRKAGQNMDDETNGVYEATQSVENTSRQQGQEQQKT